MKKLLLALLFALPFQVLLAQNVKVIPASMNSSAKKEAAVDYNPASPTVKPDAEKSDSKGKKVKCVPGCSDKKQCIKKTSSSKNSPPPFNSEEKTSESSKK